MKICLVRCPSPFLIEDKAFPPLGLLSVGTGLKLHGHEVVIHDGPLAEIPIGYEGYGFGPTAPEYPHSLIGMDLIREYAPKAKVILGGPHATLNFKSCCNDGWDCIVVGDGDLIAHDAFVGEEHLLFAGDQPLDNYPIPDRTLINLTDYEYWLNGRLATTLVTSRGCPFRCAFCCKNHNRVRFRSAAKVIEEIDLLHFQFGYNALLFPEDIFILDRNRAEVVCSHLKSLNIIWRCLVRADVLVRYGVEFIRMMKDCGCVAVGIGVESGSQAILETIQKGESLETIKTAIYLLKAEGIHVKGFFVIGLPSESPETLAETEQFIAEMPLDDFDCKIYNPYPGSPIYDHRERYDIHWTDVNLSQSFYKGRPGEYHGNVSTSLVTTEQIVASWKRIEQTYKRWEET